MQLFMYLKKKNVLNTLNDDGHLFQTRNYNYNNNICNIHFPIIVYIL